MVTEYVVTAGELPKRLDVFLVNRVPKLSRSALQRLIEQGRLRVNGQIVKPSHKIRPGEIIAFDIPKAEPLELKGESIPLEILYEHTVLLILNKPAGLVVHPAPGHWGGTLVNALLYHFQTSGGTVSTIGGKERPGLVHRLDKDTSGVMVIPKTDEWDGLNYFLLETGNLDNNVFRPLPFWGIYRVYAVTVTPDPAHPENNVLFDAISAEAVPAIPEPASLLLFGTGLVGLRAWRKRRQ